MASKQEGSALKGTEYKMDLDQGESVGDIGPYFPILHIDEVRESGELASEECEDSRGFVVSNDFRAAMGFELVCPDLRFYSQEGGDQIHEKLAGVLETLKIGERLQFVWTVTDEMSPLYDAHVSKPKGGDAFGSFVRRKWLEREKRRFAEGKMRQFECHGFLQVPPASRIVEAGMKDGGGLMGSISDFVTSLVSGRPFMKVGTGCYFPEDLMQDVKGLKARMNTIERLISGIPGLEARSLKSSEFFGSALRACSPGWWGRFGRKGLSKILASMDADTPMSALFFREGISKDLGHSFMTGNYHHRILTLNFPPPFVEMGHLICAIADMDILNLTGNLQFALTITPENREREVRAVKSKLNMVSKRYNANPKMNSSLKTEIEELEAQLDKMENSAGGTMLQCDFAIHFWDEDPDRMTQIEETLMQNIKLLAGMEMLGEQFSTLPCFLERFLPGAPAGKDSHRALGMAHDEAAPLIPLMGQGMGVLKRTPIPDVPTMVETQLSTPFGLDLFAKGVVSNYNGMVLGGSGSGKSFLMNHLLGTLPQDEFEIICVDAAVGAPSFENVCALRGGEYYSDKFCLNAMETAHDPVTGKPRVPDSREMAGIIAVVTAMVTAGSGSALKPEEKAVISKAVNYTFENRPDDGVVHLKHLVQTFRSNSFVARGDPEYETAHRFGNIIGSSYAYPDGANMYAQFMDGPNTVLPSPIRVFDLKWALDKGDFLEVLVSLIFRYIDMVIARNMERPESERKKIIVVTDEGWKPLSTPAGMELYAGIYRAGRSRWTSSLILTQLFSDMANMIADGGSSPIVANTSHIISMNMDYKEAKLLGETFDIPDCQWRQLPKLRMVAGQYSSFGYFCRSVSTGGFIYNTLNYVPLKEELWAYTSDAGEDARRSAVAAKYRGIASSSKEGRAKVIAWLGSLGWDPVKLERVTEDALGRYAAVSECADPDCAIKL